MTLQVHPRALLNNLNFSSLSSPLFLDHDSYWIGASDLAYEGHYQWSDGHAFSYSSKYILVSMIIEGFLKKTRFL